MQGKIIFISGPSGVGKGTLIDGLRTAHPDWIFPPSCTTRSPRPGEQDGVTYHFISHEEFEKKIEAGDFLEYAEVHGGNFYGTLKKPLIEGVEQSKIVVREFDVQGFVQARQRLPREYFTSIFLKPSEGLNVLKQRIRDRAPISEEELERRMKSTEKELKLSELYDHVIFSEEGEIEQLINDAENIISKNLSAEGC